MLRRSIFQRAPHQGLLTLHAKCTQDNKKVQFEKPRLQDKERSKNKMSCDSVLCVGVDVGADGDGYGVGDGSGKSSFGKLASLRLLLPRCGTPIPAENLPAKSCGGHIMSHKEGFYCRYLSS
jgi:hypothetical protein